MTSKNDWYRRISRIFRSPSSVKRRIRDYRQPPTSTALELFSKSQSFIYNNAINSYGQYDRLTRYADFSEMEFTPEISAALDIYADEAVSQDEKGRILHIFSDNRKIRDLLEDLYYDVLNVDFNLRMWVRNLVKYGDFFAFLDIAPGYGVINAFPVPVNEIEREEGFDPDDPLAVRFRWVTQGNIALENWQVAHFRMLGNDAFLPYGSSLIEPARRIWRQLILIEDAMMVYRVVRSPERRIFYVDVGGVPPEEVNNYMEQQKQRLRSNTIVDSATGRIDARYSPLSVEMDYFIPRRGNDSGTEITTLAGGQHVSATEDVEYIQRKLFAALKVPRAYLGYDEALCLTGDTIISLSDGRNIRLDELVELFKSSDDDICVRSYVDGVVIPGRVVDAWQTKIVDELFEIELDDGMIVRCTPNHPFMLRTGEYVRADELIVGTNLMSLSNDDITDCRSVVCVRKISCEPTPVYDITVEGSHNFAIVRSVDDECDRTVTGVFVHNSSKSTLAMEDIRFSRTIQTIQKVVLAELQTIAYIHLYMNGYDGNDMFDFELRLTNPSSTAQQQKLELYNRKFEIIGNALGIGDGQVFSQQYLLRTLMDMSDQQQQQLSSEVVEDIQRRAALNKIAEGASPESVGFGPGSGGSTSFSSFDSSAGIDDGGDESSSGFDDFDTGPSDTDFDTDFDEGPSDTETDDLFAADIKDGDVIGEYDPADDIKSRTSTGPSLIDDDVKSTDDDKIADASSSDDDTFSTAVNVSPEVQRKNYNRARRRTHGAEALSQPDLNRMVNIVGDPQQNPIGDTSIIFDDPFKNAISLYNESIDDDDSVNDSSNRRLTKTMISLFNDLDEAFGPELERIRRDNNIITDNDMVLTEVHDYDDDDANDVIDSLLDDPIDEDEDDEGD